MTTDKEALIYRKISKVCGFVIPILYLVAALTFLAGIAVMFVIFFGDGGELKIGRATLDIPRLRLFSRLVISIGFAVILFFSLRFFWFLLNVAKLFKQGEIFEASTAKYASLAAFNFLLAQVFSMFTCVYAAVISGDMAISPPDGLISVLFAYLFAWVLSIGSQLKAENDLTV